jgi:hypothetical protein
MRAALRHASPLVVMDMRDDHFRRRTTRPSARSGSTTSGGSGPEAEPAAARDAEPAAAPGAEPRPRPRQPRDPVMRWLVVAIAVCIAGCAVLLALAGSDAVTFAGIALGGIAFVLVLAAAFYAVGRSEDRARSTDRAARDDRPPT